MPGRNLSPVFVSSTWTGVPSPRSITTCVKSGDFRIRSNSARIWPIIVTGMFAPAGTLVSGAP